MVFSLQLGCQVTGYISPNGDDMLFVVVLPQGNLVSHQQVCRCVCVCVCVCVLCVCVCVSVCVVCVCV